MSTIDPELLAKSIEALPVHIYSKMMPRHLLSPADVDDLIQAGRIGVWRAFRSYTPERGVKWGTYATRYAQGCMLTELTRIRVRGTGMKADTYWESRKRGEPEPLIMRAGSMDVKNAEGVTWGESLVADAESPEDTAIAGELVRVCLAALARLPERDQRIVTASMRGRSFAEIGKELGVSRQAVRLRYRKALTMLQRDPQIRAVVRDIATQGM